MFEKFTRKQYSKRRDGKYWTKNTVLRQMIDELEQEGVAAKLKGNDLILREDSPTIGVTFGSSNNPVEDKIELIGSIYVQNGDEYTTWEDLFSVAKDVYGPKYRALSLYRDEDWDSSPVKRETHEVYAPLFRRLQEPEGFEALKAGEPIPLPIGIELSLWKLPD